MKTLINIPFTFSARFLCALAFLMTAGCTNTHALPPTTTSNLSIIAEGQNSGFTLQKTLVIESTNEFKQLWSIHTGSQQTPVPIIDFNTNIVIASFLGEQHTGGHSIKVGKIIEAKHNIQVHLKVKRPKPGSMRTMQITQPFVIFSLRKVSKAKQTINFIYSKEL